MPISERKPNLIEFCDEVLPVLVVIWITPLPARAPYSDAAAAPFTTSTDSMSSGFRSGRPPLMMMPSTTYSGSCVRPDALMDVGARRMTLGCAPGRPDAATICAPATLPCSCVSGLVAGTGIWSEVTRATVKGVFVCSVAPVTPVTTSSVSRLTSFCSAKSNV